MVSVDEPVENAWLRSHAQCEGPRRPHRQTHRCARHLIWEHRGRAGHQGAWEAYRKSPHALAGWEAVRQIAILCWECYQQGNEGDRRAKSRAGDRAAPLDSRGGRA